MNRRGPVPLLLLSSFLFASATTFAPATAFAQPPAAAPDGKIKLALRLRAGQTTRLNYTTDQVTTEATQGKFVEIKSNVSLGMEMHVATIHDDGSFTVVVTYKTVRMKMESPDLRLSYDSEVPAAPLDVRKNPAGAFGTALWGALKGQSIKLRLLPSGAVREIAGIDELWVSMKKAIPLPEPFRGFYEKLFDSNRRQFSDQQALSLGIIAVTFSEKAVGIGDFWQYPAAKTANNPVAMSNQYTLRSRRDGLAAIEVGTQLKFRPVTGLTAFDGAGLQIGTLHVDEATGWMRSGDLTCLMTGTVTYNDEKGGAAFLKVPLYCRSDIRISTIEK